MQAKKKKVNFLISFVANQVGFFFKQSNHIHVVILALKKVFCEYFSIENPPLTLAIPVD